MYPHITEVNGSSKITSTLPRRDTCRLKAAWILPTAPSIKRESFDTPQLKQILRALVPVAHISATTATRALSLHQWRSSTSPGKMLPERSFGMRGVSILTQMARLRSQYPSRLFAPAPHTRSASASITASRPNRRACAATPACRWRRLRTGAWRACPASGLVRFP